MSTIESTQTGSTDASKATFEFPEPVTHGAGITFHYDDLGLYDQHRDLWRSDVGDPAEQPITIAEYQPEFITRSGDFALRFRSSNWKAGKEGANGWRRWYKYHLTLRERVTDDRDQEHWNTPAASLNITIEPQATGLTYKDGNELTLPFGEGTRVIVQTTYPNSPEDVLRRTNRALSEVFDYDSDAYDPELGRITKLEAYVRFDESLMNSVIECTENSKRLIAYGGGGLNARQDRMEEGYIEALLKTDRWDALGFENVGYSELVKVYRIGNWINRPSSDPLRHPKLEAAYNGGETSHPRLSEWDDVITRLQHNVAQHAQWTGLKPEDLVADPYYLGEHAPVGEYPALDGRRVQLRQYYETLRDPIIAEVRNERTQSPFDVLSIMLEESGATYDELERLTGLSRSMVRKHVARFEERGFVQRIGNPVVVVFEAPYVEDIVRQVIEGFDPDTVSGRRSERERRADERRSAREDPSNTEENEAAQTTQERFKHIDEMEITAAMLSPLIACGYLTEHDIRVRCKDDLEAKAIKAINSS